MQPRDGGLVAVLVNDTAEAWSEQLSVTRRDYDGKELYGAEQASTSHPGRPSCCRWQAEVATAGDAARELVVVQASSARGLWFFAEDRDSELATPALDASATRTGHGYQVTVTAIGLVRDLALLVDKVDPDARADDMLATLLPGESVTWQVTSALEVEPAAFLDPAVLRSANQLVHTTQR